MVVDEIGDNEADLIFHALSDRTRRDIMDRVGEREQSISSLARHYTVSFAAIQKHVAVLERASLVTKRVRGREKLVCGNVEALRRASRLLARYERIWEHRDEAIARLLKEEDERTAP
ncbi:MAG: winged helix-turn-helix domain-containing protein [Actinomycetota bacterium]|nr:winged helix-turn-helix domain-containing protein [Actinomycetota bacterium]